MQRATWGRPPSELRACTRRFAVCAHGGLLTGRMRACTAADLQPATNQPPPTTPPHPCSSDNVHVSRKQASVEYGRPLAQNWNGSLGFRCARMGLGHGQRGTALGRSTADAAVSSRWRSHLPPGTTHPAARRPLALPFPSRPPQLAAGVLRGRARPVPGRGPVRGAADRERQAARHHGAGHHSYRVQVRAAARPCSCRPLQAVHCSCVLACAMAVEPGSHCAPRPPVPPPAARRSHPSGDTELVASMEQAVPLQGDWLNFNRFAVRAEKTVPIGPLRCSPGRCGSGAGAGAPCVVGGAGGQQQQQQEEQAWAAACRRAGPATPHHRPHLHSRRVWARGKGGMIVGDLPAYEAFPIGGTNSVRGYSEGACCRGGLDRPGAGRPAPSSPGCPGLPSPAAPAHACMHPPASPQAASAPAATLWRGLQSCVCRWCRRWRPLCLPTGGQTWTAGQTCRATPRARAASQVQWSVQGRPGGRCGQWRCPAHCHSPASLPLSCAPPRPRPRRQRLRLRRGRADRHPHWPAAPRVRDERPAADALPPGHRLCWLMGGSCAVLRRGAGRRHAPLLRPPTASVL